MEIGLSFVQRCIDEFKKEYGENAKLEDGDRFATVFNDGVVVISFIKKILKVEVIGGKPYFINENIKFIKDETLES